ncbi:TauD/TfdA dioxygenase family protein [Azotobacter vinelandii]|uniref:TauD/TfdA dioxygenase family protein n=1 Tax=Azotobacter vinelandii TaxID=354 RepID=UPI0026671751|nr:TauD/TfdA family dioxygenase [Azotobacter vinelandii]WKN22792.1 TauD/TfdA family dioxygenase [Azotobacter vinelandii]
MSNAALNLESNDLLDIQPITGRIGAEIRGVKLSTGLDAVTLGAIQDALLRYKVLFFRDQTLDDAEQEGLAELFGDPAAHPTVPVREGSRCLLELDSTRRANSWHTDVTFVEDYPKICILRSLVAPAFGGDTVWANTATAYDDLPAELRELADRLWAVHSNEYDYTATQKPDVDPTVLAEHRRVFTSTLYETEHPLVRVHPQNGERSLLVGNFIKRVKGLSKADSQRLLDIFQGYATREENTVRWRWRAGDVAIWDNRATLHRAVDDYGTQDRLVRRATVAGEVPVSVDGRRSQTVRKG